MLSKEKNQDQKKMFSTLKDPLNQQYPLLKSSNKIDNQSFEDSFKTLYPKQKGRPSKYIHLIYGLLILKHLKNISYESVVEQWNINTYYQYFVRSNCFYSKIFLQFYRINPFHKTYWRIWNKTYPHS